MSKRDIICRKIIEWGIFGLIVLSPLPKASVHEWSILVIQLVVFIMMIAYLLMQDKPVMEIQLKESLRWPRYLFTGLFVLIFVQILPWPKFLLNLISPKSVNFREMYAAGFTNVKFMGLSLIPSHTLQAGLELLAYVLLGFLVVKTVTQRKQILRIVYAVIGMGIFQAFYGLFELYNKNPRLLFYKKIHYLSDVTGTFVNRNHLSGYLEMVIPLTIGLILVRSDIFATVGLSLRRKVLSLAEKNNYRTLLMALGVILMAVAVVFSRSRSGIFLLMLTFVLLFGMGTVYTGSRQQYQKGMKRFVQVVFLMIVVLCLFVGIDSTLERFALDNILNEVRPLVWGNTAAIIGDYSIFGSGLGTFSAVYPAYEENVMSAQVLHAHNDYLEYFAELGVVGGLLLLAGILFMLIISFLVWKEKRNPEVKGLALGGIIAVVN
ncbi:O-antigen ligase family protein, partial [Acidobacteriota bacterium]